MALRGFITELRVPGAELRSQ